jgi:hypothetical protein
VLFRSRGVKYLVAESPKFKKSLPILKEILRHPESQDTEARDTEAQEALRKNNLKKEQDKEYSKEKRVKENIAPSLERKPYVSTTEEEHKKLVDKFGEEKTRIFYKILSDWKEDTPKLRWKKNDYRSILRWVVNKFEEEEKKCQKNKSLGFSNLKQNSSAQGSPEPVFATPEEVKKIFTG